MTDTWINHNTDKLLLFSLVLLAGFLILHIIHHGGDASTLDWAENEFSTVLGALILILTGRIARSDGQTANGIPPATAPPVTLNPSPEAQPSAPAQPGK